MGGCSKLINTATGKVGVAVTSAEKLSLSERLQEDTNCVQVVGVFSKEGGKAKGAKDEGESNSVESVGFCNT